MNNRIFLNKDRILIIGFIIVLFLAVWYGYVDHDLFSAAYSLPHGNEVML